MDFSGTPPDVSGLSKTYRTIKVITCVGYVACGFRVARLSSIMWKRAAVILNDGSSLLTYDPPAILVIQKREADMWSQNSSLVGITTMLIPSGKKVLDISDEVC